MDEQLSELYISIISTPVEFPDCFAGNGIIKKTLERNGLDPYTTGNAIGRFLAFHSVKYLYVSGNVGTQADSFFSCLKRILSTESEVVFCDDSDYVDEVRGEKIVVRHKSLDRNFETQNHVVIEFRKRGMFNFNREMFAAFVYCANGDDGPNRVYECRSLDKVQCIRRRYTGKRTCGVCFWIDEKAKLKTFRRLRVSFDYDDVDEGCVCNSLNVNPELYFEQFGETDTETVPENDSEYDSDVDYLSLIHI